MKFISTVPFTPPHKYWFFSLDFAGNRLITLKSGNFNHIFRLLTLCSYLRIREITINSVPHFLHRSNFYIEFSLPDFFTGSESPKSQSAIHNRRLFCGEIKGPFLLPGSQYQPGHKSFQVLFLFSGLIYQCGVSAFSYR